MIRIFGGVDDSELLLQELNRMINNNVKDRDEFLLKRLLILMVLL